MDEEVMAQILADQKEIRERVSVLERDHMLIKQDFSYLRKEIFSTLGLINEGINEMKANYSRDIESIKKAVNDNYSARTEESIQKKAKIEIWKAFLAICSYIAGLVGFGILIINFFAR